MIDVRRKWIARRPVTVRLSVFLLVWYAFELLVLHTFGAATARWWFYTEIPPPFVTGGLLFAPLSHNLFTVTHITGNVGLLVGVGGLIEPYADGRKILWLVIGGGYVGMVVTMLTAPIHQSWPVVGTSTGLLILFAYTGFRMWDELGFTHEVSTETIEEQATLFIVVAIPVIPVYELVWNGNMSHVTGIVLGVLYFLIETTDYNLPLVA